MIFIATSGGNVVGVDATNGDILYGYGVMKKGECRLLGFNKDKTRLVCAGEDDAASLLSFWYPIYLHYEQYRNKSI